MIVYHAGSLFDAPAGTVLIHAASTRGVWGAGIAVQFRKRFPIAYQAYRNRCQVYQSAQDCEHLVGTASATADSGYVVATLFTSNGYGDGRDSPDRICLNTGLALRDLVQKVMVFWDTWSRSNKEVYFSGTGSFFNLPKINSGLFRVPWARTAMILKWDHPSITWNVWSLT